MLSKRVPRLLVATTMNLTLLASLLTMAPVARAAGAIYVTTVNQEINGDAECSLQEAIYSANRDDNTAPDPTNPGTYVTTGCAAGSGADTIYLPASAVFTYADPITDPQNYMGPSANPIVTSTIVIEGQGARLQRHPLGRLTRAFAVGATGDLTLHELHVKGFSVHGGNGADGGGGGMGSGGAVYVQGGRLGIGWSTFEGNSATGGNGSYEDAFGGGGGGGLSGNGGNAAWAGGGGGGSRGNGADGYSELGGGGGGTDTSGVAADPGQLCGGRGGEYNELTGGADDGDSAPCAGGGGGGGTERVPFFDPFGGGAGGAGSYGGGGGGGGEDADGGHGGFGGGGGGSFSGQTGGDGGFGGGGGSGSQLVYPFGGRGQGGTFAGDGGAHGGGGGAALGGAIFGYGATIEIVNSTFTGNSVHRGLSGAPGGDDPASDGRGAGGAIFTVAGSLKIDGSTIAGNSTGEFDVDGGGNVTGLGGGGIVVYKPTTGESASLLLRNTIVANNGPFECYTRNGVSVVGSSSNLVTDSTVNGHGDPHCTGVVQSVDPQLGPLQLNAPGRTPTMAIPFDSSAVDAADPGTAPVDDQRGMLRGVSPDIGAFEFSGQAPVTAVDRSPSSPDGLSGWYVSPVGLAISATDPDSTVAQTRCALDPASVPASFAALPAAACALTSVATDGEHAVYAASVDTEGNVEIPVVSATFKIDRTDPTLAPTLSATTIQLNQTGVSASPHAADTTSGVASASCDPVDTSTPGVHSVECTAADNAGNTATASIDYVVEYQILGFFEPAPGSKWRAGSTVPIKIALGDAGGNRIDDADAQALARACALTFSVSGAQAKHAQCMKYDAIDDQFVFTWKLAKMPLGDATIKVTVAYAGTTSTTELSELITIIK